MLYGKEYLVQELYDIKEQVVMLKQEIARLKMPNNQNDKAPKSKNIF